MSYFQSQHQANVQTLCNEIKKLPRDAASRSLVQAKGLDIVEVAWEDTARYKNSSVGPNISDMTLLVSGVRMPLFRHPNFTDFTWDVPMDQIPLVVGNENGTARKSVSLTDYLKNITEYTGLSSSLYSPSRDSHALVSAQSCFLPVPPKQESLVYFGTTPPVQDPTKFDIAIFNYQSSDSDPAVLTIVATSKGTSAQILGGYNSLDRMNGQKLYFNNNGSKHAFHAQRLTYDRIQRGETDLTKPMTDEEKQNNAIVVIQVPLKRKVRAFSPTPLFGGATSVYNSNPFPGAIPTSYTSSSFGLGAEGIKKATYSLASGVRKPGAKPKKQSVPFAYSPLVPSNVGSFGSPPSSTAFSYPTNSSDVFSCSDYSSDAYEKPVDVENAIISLAPSEGLFPSLKGRDLTRDDRFPVRVTIQWYKVTSTGKVDTAVVDEVSQQMEMAKSKADFWGSLVVDQESWNNRANRPTAPIPSLPTIVGSHPDVICDCCNTTFAENTMRYRCLYCPDFDICQSCRDRKAHGHNPKHMFAAVEDSTLTDLTTNVRMTSKVELQHNVHCSQCSQNIVGARFVCAICKGPTPGLPVINLCDCCADMGRHGDNRHPLIRVWHSEDLRQIGLV
ncbi:hypothetical protein Unana1_02254 [Umbelopsis nana]